jgi:hypothetical protein
VAVGGLATIGVAHSHPPPSTSGSHPFNFSSSFFNLFEFVLFKKIKREKINLIYIFWEIFLKFFKD